MLKYLIIITLILFSKSFANDPFTQEIGIIKKPEVVEIEIEKEVEEVAEAAVEEVVDVVVEDIVEEVVEVEKVKEIVKVETVEVVEEIKKQEIVKILNIDPMIAYSLNRYVLKGTALSFDSKNNFKRTKVKKIDQAKTPTTHTIMEGDTVEKIAFRYGFTLREIEVANAIYPGSRKLIAGDKIIIPNRFHIAKEGQALNTIADIYKISPVQLATYNDIKDDDNLLIGDKLLLPFFIHVTNEKESIKDIAGRYEREISELVEFNSFEEKTLLLNENQMVKIPIYANKNIEFSSLEKKSINDFFINRKNLAIVEIDGGQFMVREGDSLGNKDGAIVSIEANKMIVLEDNIEFEFLINTPIVGQSVASLPRQVDDSAEIEDNNMDSQEQNNNDESETGVNDQSNVDDDETITDVESLFN